MTWAEVERVVSVGRGSAGDGRGGVARRPALPNHASEAKGGSGRSGVSNGVCDPWLAEARFAAACRTALAARRACLTRLGRLFDESVMAERRRAKALGTGAEIVTEALAVLGGSGVTGETEDGKASVTASRQSRSLINVQSAAAGLCRDSDALRPKLERRVRPMLGALLSAAGQSRRADARAEGSGGTSGGGGGGGRGGALSTTSTDVRPAALGFADDGTDLWADEDLTRSGPSAEPGSGSASESSAGSHHARPSALSFVSMAPADVPRPIDSPQVVRWGSVLVRSSGFMKKWQPGIAVVTSMGWLHLWSGGASEVELGSNRDDVARQVSRHGSHVPAEPRRGTWATDGASESATSSADTMSAGGGGGGGGAESADPSRPTSAMGVPAVFPAGKSFSGLADITDESMESLVTGSLPLVEPWRSIDLVTCAPGSAAAERDDDMAAAAASAVKRQAPSGRGGETVEVEAGKSGAEGHGTWVVRLKRPGLFGTSVETITLRCRPGRADGSPAEAGPSAASSSPASTSPSASAAGGASGAAADEEQVSAELAEGWIRDCWAVAHGARSFE